MVKRRAPTCRRNRRGQRGGTGGFAYSFGAAVPGTLGDGIVERSASCGNVYRPAPYSGTGQGLPGMNGGAYTNMFEVYGPNAISNQMTIPCEATRTQNPLNLAGPSRITAPPPQMPSPIIGGKRTRKSKREMRGGVGGVGSELYIAPRAGYSHVPSDMAGGESGTLADGKTPFLLNVPYSSENVSNPACSKTGGKRRNKGRKSRKNRKGKKSKKSRKH